MAADQPGRGIERIELARPPRPGRAPRDPCPGRGRRRRGRAARVRSPGGIVSASARRRSASASRPASRARAADWSLQVAGRAGRSVRRFRQADQPLRLGDPLRPPVRGRSPPSRRAPRPQAQELAHLLGGAGCDPPRRASTRQAGPAIAGRSPRRRSRRPDDRGRSLRRCSRIGASGTPSRNSASPTCAVSRSSESCASSRSIRYRLAIIHVARAAMIARDTATRPAIEDSRGRLRARFVGRSSTVGSAVRSGMPSSRLRGSSCSGPAGS